MTPITYLKYFCLFIFLYCSSNIALIAQSKSEKLEDLLFEMYENNQFNGAVAVVDKGNLIFAQAYGWANHEKKDTFKLSTPCRLASVSKQFTAMAIMILAERGVLSYEDDITRFLPELPYDNVKIKHLLLHCSGIPDYFWLEDEIESYYWNKKVLHNQDIVDYFAEKKPAQHFTPGSKAQYSNSGYVFLASIIERASQMPFAKFMEENIFKPLKMNHTFIYNAKNYERFEKHDTILVKRDTILLEKKKLKIDSYFKVESTIELEEKRRAIGYELSFPYPNGYILRDFDEMDGVVGEKGVCASIEDLLKWDKALHDNVLVSQKTLQDAFSAGFVTDSHKYTYGYGWRVYQTKGKEGIVYHHGQYRGFRTFLQRNPFDKSTIIILNNRRMDDGALYELIDSIEDILAGRDYRIPKQTHLEKVTMNAFKQHYKVEYRKRMGSGTH